MNYMNIVLLWQNIIDYFDIPIIYMFTILLFCIYNKWLTLIIYVIAYIISKKINIWINKYYSRDTNKDTTKDDNGIISIHSQNIWLTSSFIYLNFSNIFIRLVYLLTSFFIMWKSFKYNNLMQIIVGMAIGISIGYICNRKWI